MQMSMQYSPELFVSNDAERPDLRHVYLDVKKSRVIATDGKRAIVVKVTTDKGDTEGFIPVNAIKLAKQNAPKDSTAIAIECRGKTCVLSDGTSFVRPLGNFPDIDAIIPKAAEFKGGKTATLRAKYLYDAARATGADAVTMQINDQPEGMFRIDHDDAIVVIAPCRE